jgi:phosphatidylserine/phosphatidylglycerophosphate/cardiolipin synthase-like enzyme
MIPAITLAVRLSRELPARDVRLLADAVRGGPEPVRRLAAASAGVGLRDGCRRLLDADLSTSDCQLAAGAMLGALEADPAAAKVDVVWTGPDSELSSGRLTSAVVVELIDRAVFDVLLVGFAVHTEPTVAAALKRACQRDVAITLLVERAADNPWFSGSGAPFPGLDAVRLHWPADERPAGASLHAKVLVIDGRSALIGSANLTAAALGRNLECGLLINGGPVPTDIRSHVRRLHQLGVLHDLGDGS